MFPYSMLTALSIFIKMYLDWLREQEQQVAIAELALVPENLSRRRIDYINITIHKLKIFVTVEALDCKFSKNIK